MEFLSNIRLSRITNLNKRDSTKRKTLAQIVQAPQRSQVKRATFGAVRMDELKQRRKNRIKTNMENRLKMAQSISNIDRNDSISSSDLSVSRRQVQSTRIYYGTPLNVISEEKIIEQKRSNTGKKRVSRVNVLRKMKSKSISDGSQSAKQIGKKLDTNLKKRNSKFIKEDISSFSSSSS